MTKKAVRREQVKSAAIDPTTFSVIWNRLEYIAEEIGEKVLNATQSFVTANVRDLGQTILDARGRIVCAAAYLPPHMLVAEIGAQGVIETFKGQFSAGDFIIANDPYIVRGGHLPDWFFVRPVFYRDELIGFVQCKTHVADTGGFLPGGYGPGAYDIIAEGLNIPPLKFYDAGVKQTALWELLLKNVRNCRQVEMDAQLINGALAKAEAQLLKLVNKYGVETVKGAMAQIIDSGERAMREEISAIPDGVYHGESAVDWDGMTDKPVRVRLKLTVKGDEMVFDYSETDDQATFVNTPLGSTMGYTMLSVYCIVSSSVPKNSGSMLPVKLIAREGSAVNPIFPATVGAGPISLGTQISEAALMALGQAIPDRAMAAWSRHCCPINIGVEPRKIDPRTGKIEQYFAEHFASDGGSGAVKGHDGWLGVLFMAGSANFMRPNIEMYESSVPFRVTHYEVATDWEGAGQFRGAPGTHVVCVADTVAGAPSFLMTGNSDGMKFTPFGVAGGGAPPLTTMTIRAPDGKERVLRSMANDPVYPNEVVTSTVSGGGGWGDPLDRDVRRVFDDVVDEFVSIGRARDVYGVIIDPANLKVDESATARLRAQRKMRGA